MINLIFYLCNGKATSPTGLLDSQPFPMWCLLPKKANSLAQGSPNRPIWPVLNWTGVELAWFDHKN